MSTTLLDTVVIPTFISDLKTLDHILTKSTAFAKSKGLDPNTYFSASLIEDQKPFSFQVQTATWIIVQTLGRFGVEYKQFHDNEATVEELHVRIRDTLALITSLKAGAYAKGEEVIGDVRGGGGILDLTAKQAALGQGIPNVFFHTVTAYSILRAKGVPVGKADWINSFLGLTSPAL